MLHHRPLPRPVLHLRALSLAAALATAAAALTPAPGLAGPFAPVVLVNDSAVTGFEIEQRLRFMQLLRAPDASRAEVEEELIGERLKMDTARQLGISVTDANLVAGLAEFAGRANMGTEEFIAALAGGGVESETYRDFVRAGLAWREVVRQRIVPTLTISEAEIDRAMVKILDTPDITDVLVSELILPAPEGTEARAMVQAEELRASIRSEAGFAAAARQHSASPTAPEGGRLGWLRVANLPEGLGPILTALKPGEMSPPLQVPGAVVLFYMRDTRGTLRPGAQAEDVDYLTLTVDSVQTGANILANATACDTFFQSAGTAAPMVQRQVVAANALPQGIAVRLAGLDENEGTVIDLGAAAQVLMLCKRQRSLLGTPVEPLPVAPEATGPGEAPDALPPRRAVEDNLFNQKANEAADAYLAELRANAIIRRP